MRADPATPCVLLYTPGKAQAERFPTINISYSCYVVRASVVSSTFDFFFSFLFLRCLELCSQTGWFWIFFWHIPSGTRPKLIFADIKKLNRPLCHTKFGRGGRGAAPYHYTVPISPHSYATTEAFCCRADISQSLTPLVMYGHTIVVTYCTLFTLKYVTVFLNMRYFIRAFFFSTSFFT